MIGKIKCLLRFVEQLTFVKRLLKRFLLTVSEIFLNLNEMRLNAQNQKNLLETRTSLCSYRTRLAYLYL